MKVSDGGREKQGVSLPQFRKSHLEVIIFAIVVINCCIIIVKVHINGLYSKCLLYNQMLDCKQEKDDVQPQASPEGTSTQVLGAISLLLNMEHATVLQFLM